MAASRAGDTGASGPPPVPAARPVLRLPRNATGRDFVVGDVHGCFEPLLAAMSSAGFDRNRDRIIAVGDLVNRGPDSRRALKFLANPFVSSVRGNHEDLILRLHRAGSVPQELRRTLAADGLGWWFEAPDAERASVAAAFAALPLAIEVETESGPLGIVHADVPKGLGWEEFVDALEMGDPSVSRAALWGRDRVRSARPEGVPGIPRVAVGHTIVPEPLRFGNVYALDTGAVEGAAGGAGRLTFVPVAGLTPSMRGTPARA